MIKNRIAHLQPDYVLAIVRKPKGWQPTRLHDVPPEVKVLSRQFVASFAEAYDDLIRCNKLSIKRGLDTWAVVYSPGGQL